MFSSNHYIPILKWKRAEMQALERLSSHEKSLITPFFQIVMPSPQRKKKDGTYKTPGELLEDSISTLRRRLTTIPEEINKHWGNNPAFIDVGLVDSSIRTEALRLICEASQSVDISLVPATRFSANASMTNIVASMARSSKSGMCLRVSENDCSVHGQFEKKLKELLNKYKLTINTIDLLIDYQDHQCLDITDLCSRLPNLQEWRTITFACGSFPEDLTPFKVGEENYTERADWNNWSKQIKSKKKKRFPSYGDYTIQHPIYRDSTQFFTPSASLRYTLNDKWLILRGQRGKSVQYLAHARLLSQDQRFEGMYYGSDFSYGDSYIAEKGKDLKGKTGNATTWLTAGINHHLACTVSQIASLT